MISQQTYSAEQRRLMYLSLPDNLKDIIYSARRSIKPLPKVKLSDWIAENRVIKSTRESPYRGKWNPDLFPFVNEIMDCFTDDVTDQITMMGSAQVAKTEIIKNVLAYYSSYDPQNALLVEPTQDLGRAFSIDKLEPMIEANPDLFKNMSAKKSRDSANTHLHKTYLGGSLNIVGANSPNDLSARSKKIVLSDDVDRMPTSAGEEGDPVLLAEERTEAYKKIGGFKHGRFSTPTKKGSSRIKKLYDASDQRQYYVPCPFCFEMQTLKFDNLVWDKETGMFGEVAKFHANTSNPNVDEIVPIGKKDDHHIDTVQYACEHCGSLIDEVHKPWMLKNGKWIAKFPERIKHKGYWINRLYSPLSTWNNLVAKFLDVYGVPDDYKEFINTSLAEVYDEEGAAEIDHNNLIDLTEDFNSEDHPTIPNNVLLITGGVDCHPDRLILSFVGWGLNREPYLLHYEILPGDIAMNDVWDDLDGKLELKFTRDDGLVLPVGIRKGLRKNYLAFVDASDGNTSLSVYQQCKRRQGNGVYAIKGRSVPGNHILISTTKVGPKKETILKNINPDAVKDRIFRILNKMISKKEDAEIKGPVMHFSSRFCDEEYFEGLASEKPIPIYDRKLGMKILWKKKYKAIRNEPLDTFVYAWAAMESILPNFEQIKKNLDKKIPDPASLRCVAAGPAVVGEKDEEKVEMSKGDENKSEKKKKVKPVRRSNWVTQY